MMKTDDQHLKEQLASAAEYLKSQGVQARDLAVFVLAGNEQIIGEVIGRDGYGKVVGDRLVGQMVEVKNPRRLIRLQRMTANGMTVEFPVVDFDCIEDGRMQVFANVAYWVSEQSKVSQNRLLALYVSYLLQRAQVSAVNAGIVLPEASGLVIPGR